MCVRTFGDGLHDVLDVIDGVRHAGVLRHALVCEVDFTVLLHSHVLQEGVALDGVVNIGLRLFVEVDDLGIASAFVVEHAFVVPSVFVVADEQTFRVGRQSSLACAGQTEEDSRVSAFHVGVGRAVHGSDAAERVEVVHDGEDTFLHLTAVPSVQDDLLASLEVEDSSCLRVQAEFLVVVHFSLGSVERHEVGFAVVFQFFCRRTDEHVGHEVCLPCHFHDEAHFQAGSSVSAAECVDHEQTLAAEFLHGFSLQVGPSLFRARLVVILIFVRSPPHGVLACLVVYEEFVFRRTAGVDTSHYIYCTQFCHLTFFITFQRRFGLFCEQNIVRRIVNDFLHVGDSVLAQIQICHCC